MIEASTIYHVGVSGGKDSTSLLLWAVYESGISHSQIVASFCDTQNEADCTYEHIYWLSFNVFPIVWLGSEGFFQLAKRKKRFPSTKARFCTQELKLKPTKKFIEELQGGFSFDEENERAWPNVEVIGLSGVRRGESLERSKLSEWGNPLESYFHIREWRPLIDWTLKDVLAIHDKYNAPLNPLYSKGARRVGCFPCVMSIKSELRMVGREYPGRVDRIRQAEREMEQDGHPHTFFHRGITPPRFHSKVVKTKAGNDISIATIDDVVRWANTGKGATGLPCDEDLFADQTRDLPPHICLAQHLACE